MTTKTQKTEFSLNFGGFYHSQHSENIENNIESYGYEWDEIDYKKTHLNYCNSYLNRLSEDLEINLKFIQLDSPREYNFVTDKILCSISENDFNTLLDVYDTKELFNYIEEHSKSRDGFSSFYSGYAAVKKEKDIFLQYLFNYILEYENFDFYDLEFEIEIKEINLIKQ
tara:strand:- start:445 stop:951 length:507 start_codon:yes stop_codon:yes gene_type:complete